MKLPSISRIPKHQQFNYTPRFYDPIKEDIEQRRESIRRDLAKGSSSNYQSSIHNAFRRRTTANNQSSILQLLIIILLLATFFGYIYYGNIILYLSFALVPIYLLVRKKNNFRKS